MNETGKTSGTPTVVSVQRLQTGKKRARVRLVATVQLAAPSAPVFATLSNPHELDGLTPDWFRIRLSHALPDPLRAGVRIRYRMHVKGLPWVWESHIDHWDPGVRFSYTQTRGPYRWFWHDHRFTALEGGTRVVDVVEFAAIGGRAVDRWIATPWLSDLFRWRAEELVRRFGNLDGAIPLGPGAG